MLRITYRQLNNNIQYVINDRFADMTHLQEMLSTGKRLLRPSDNPVDVANDLQLRSSLSSFKQFKENIDDAIGFMSVTDTTMVSMNDLFHRLRELAIQASSDTQTANERNYILKEAEQLFRQLVTLGNTQFKGDYIFAGTQTKITPFPIETSQSSTIEHYANGQMAYYDGSGGVGVAAQLRDGYTGDPITRIIPGTFRLQVAGTEYVEGTDYTVDYVNGTLTPLNPALAADVSDGGTLGGPNYQMGGFNINFDYVSRGTNIYGDLVDHNGDILREVEAGITVPINITQDELMYDPSTGTHMLDAVVRFGQSLQTSDSAGIRNAISQIDTVFENILEAQSKNGARVNRFETTLGRNEQQFNEASRLQSNLEDAEFAETITDFSLLENVYNAALKSAARIIQPSLANFL